MLFRSGAELADDEDLVQVLALFVRSLAKRHEVQNSTLKLVYRRKTVYTRATILNKGYTHQVLVWVVCNYGTLTAIFMKCC